LLGRLSSGLDEQFQGAIWELYIYWFLEQAGFSVKRLKSPYQGRMPDFEIRAAGRVFFVEATVVAEITDSNFQAILGHLNQMKASDYFLGVTVEQRTTKMPNLDQIDIQVQDFLRNVRNDLVVKSPFSDLPIQQVAVDGWALELTAFENKTSLDNLALVGISSGQKVIEVKDDLKLLRKLEQKSTHYDEIYQTLLLAIGEHPFRVVNPREHRFSAFFGKRVLYLTNQNFSSEGRNGKGFWGLGHVPKNIPAILLGNHLDPSLGDAQDLELWLTPGESEAWINIFSIPVNYSLRQGIYGQVH
jgi:hypothetical protein